MEWMSTTLAKELTEYILWTTSAKMEFKSTTITTEWIWIIVLLAFLWIGKRFVRTLYLLKLSSVATFFIGVMFSGELAISSFNFFVCGAALYA
jgi:hypothetical protein